MYRSITGLLTVPTVEAKYERVHNDGNLWSEGYLRRSSCAVMPLHSFTISAADVVGHAITNRWIWSGWTVNSTMRQPCSLHLFSMRLLQSLAMSPTSKALRRLGVQTR